MRITIFKLTFLSTCLLLLPLYVAIGANPEVGLEKPKTIPRLSTVSIDSLLEAVRKEKNGQRAVILAEEALDATMATGSDVQKARAYHLAGVCWKNYGVPKKSLEILKIALIKYRELDMPHQEHIVLRDLGETYRASYQHALANQYLNLSLKYFLSVGDVEQLAYTYDRIGAVYFELLYDHPDYPVLDSISNWDPIAFQNNLSLFPDLKQIYLATKSNVDSAVMLARQVNLIPVMISSGILRAALDYLEQNTETANRNYDMVIGLIEETGYTRELPLALINQARIFGPYRLNQPKKAIAIASKALELATEFEIPVYAYLASEILHDNYLALGNYKMAYDMLNKLHDLYERLEFDKMKLVVASQDYESQLKEGEFEIQRRIILQRVVLLISVIVVLFLSLLLFVIYLSKRKKNAMLGELKQTNDLVMAQNEELQVVNAQKDRLISIIAHDLRNPFNSILGFSELIQEEIHSCEPADIRRYAGMIRTSAQQTLQLLTSLLEWSRFQEGRMGFSPTMHSLRSIVLEALQILLFQSKQKSINIHLQITGEHNVVVDRTMIVTVLRNLVSNALKFTYPEGNIWLEANETEWEIQVQVRDSGIGISEERKEKLFKIDSLVSTPGTRDELGSGFGLILTKEFLEKHHGRVWVESEEGKGSTFFFTLPKA